MQRPYHLHSLMTPNFRIVLLFFFLFGSAYSQEQVSYQQFEEQSDITVKSEMGLELWNYYRRTNLDSLKIVAVDLLLVASERKHVFSRAVGTRLLGSYLYQTGKIKQGLEYLNLARGYFEMKEDYVISSEIWNEIGHAFLLDGATEKAKEAYNKSLQFGEKSSDATAAFNGKLGLGRAFVVAGDTNAGMTILHAYKQKSLESEKYEAVADVFAYMAMIEKTRGNKQLSLEYFGRSIEFSKRSNSKTHEANSYANLGIQKFEQEDFDSSLYYFHKSLKLRKELRSMRPILEGYYNLGFFYLERDSLNQSIDHFESGRKLAERHEQWVDLKDFLMELISLYEITGDRRLRDRYKNRMAQVEELLQMKREADESLLSEIDLDFDEKEKGMNGEDNDGLNWVVFTSIILALLLLVFFVLEKRRFN